LVAKPRAIGIKLLMAQPVFRSMWKRHRNSYASELIEIPEQVIRDTPLTPPADSVAQFKSEMAAVQSGKPATQP
jgi:hypothetical protein